MTRSAAITAWLATEQEHIGLAWAGKDVTIADVKEEVRRLDELLARRQAAYGDQIRRAADVVQKLYSLFERATTCLEAIDDDALRRERAAQLRAEYQAATSIACTPSSAETKDPNHGQP